MTLNYRSPNNWKVELEHMTGKIDRLEADLVAAKEKYDRLMAVSRAQQDDVRQLQRECKQAERERDEAYKALAWYAERYAKASDPIDVMDAVRFARQQESE